MAALFPSHPVTFPVQEILDLVTELGVQAGIIILEELQSRQEEGEGHKEAWQKLPRSH